MIVIEPISFTEWGNQASRDFVEHQTPLNESISKIANDNSLSPMQIQRVVEQANLFTNNSLTKTSEDRTFKFELADVSKIVGDLNRPEIIKVSSDYNAAPDFHESHDFMKEFGIASVSNAPSVAEEISNYRAAGEKLAYVKEEMEMRKLNATEAVYEARDTLYKIAKQLVMNGADIGDIYRGALEITKEAKDKAVVKTAFEDVTKALIITETYGAVDRTKLAEAVQEDLISDKLDTKEDDAAAGKVQVVNGSHPVFTTVNTLVSQVSAEDAMKQGLQILEDKINYVKTKQEDLNDTKSADKYVEEENGNE